MNHMFLETVLSTPKDTTLYSSSDEDNNGQDKDVARRMLLHTGDGINCN